MCFSFFFALLFILCAMQNSDENFSESNFKRNIWLTHGSGEPLPVRLIPPNSFNNTSDTHTVNNSANGKLPENNLTKFLKGGGRGDISDKMSKNDKESTAKVTINGEKVYYDTNHGNDDDDEGDAISKFIGHYGLYQLFWTVCIILFQVPSSFHIFSFMFQVSEF